MHLHCSREPVKRLQRLSRTTRHCASSWQMLCLVSITDMLHAATAASTFPVVLSCHDSAGHMQCNHTSGFGSHAVVLLVVLTGGRNGRSFMLGCHQDFWLLSGLVCITHLCLYLASHLASNLKRGVRL